MITTNHVIKVALQVWLHYITYDQTATLRSMVCFLPLSLELWFISLVIQKHECLCLLSLLSGYPQKEMLVSLFTSLFSDCTISTLSVLKMVYWLFVWSKKVHVGSDLMPLIMYRKSNFQTSPCRKHVHTERTFN